MTAWLAGPPELCGEVDLLDAVLGDLLGVLEPYGVDSAYSSEPRTYRMTPRGRGLLRDALAARRVDQLTLSSAAQRPPHGPDEAWSDYAGAGLVLWAHQRWPDSPVQVHVAVRPAAPGAFGPTAARVAEFVTKWFAPLRAAAAFVSVSGPHGGRDFDDFPTVTGFERAPGRAVVLGWSEVRRYARGAFWGMGLGPDLCARLGGAARVVREAPVPISRAAGDGAWLQASDAPPAGPEALARLEAFLAPLLDWGAADLQALRDAAVARWRATAAPAAAALAEEAGTASVAAPASRPSRRSRGRAASRAVRVVGWDELEVDTSFNLRLAAPPTAEQTAAIVDTVRAWYEEGGRDGAYPSGFGAGAMHMLTDPTVDGRVIRWHVDLGSCDGEAAVRELARRLGALPGTTGARLVLGVEAAG